MYSTGKRVNLGEENKMDMIGFFLGGIVIYCILAVAILVGGMFIIKRLMAHKESDVEDYRTSEEIDFPRSYSIKELVGELLLRPIQTIQRGMIASGNVDQFKIGVSILAGMITVITSVIGDGSTSIVGRILGGIIGGLIVAGLIQIGRWFFIGINSLLFYYVGKVKISQFEGERIFGILFFVQYLLNGIVSIIQSLFPTFFTIVIPFEYEQSFMIQPLVVVVMVWMWYIQYLLFKERYRFTSKESVKKVAFMILASIGLSIVLFAILIAITIVIGIICSFIF